VPGATRETMVDMVGKSWNQLEALVREWAEALKGLQEAA